MNRKRAIQYLILPVFMITLFSCTRTYTPKPTGFLRIEPPTAQYTTFDEIGYPYTFCFSQYAIIERLPTDSAMYWINIDYPDFNAKIYCSYRQITPQTLSEHIEDCIKLAERAARGANAIVERQYENDNNNVYGTLLIIDGESASPIQFMLTDNVEHFFRGALYYENKPNGDSIAPITDYIKNDIAELIQTFYWK